LTCSRTVARLILALAGVAELLPAFHKTVSATTRIDAHFGFELEGADGTVDPAASRLVGKLRALLVSDFGIDRAVGPHRTSSKTRRACCNSFTCSGLALPPISR
jgi:hypothetical protein